MVLIGVCKLLDEPALAAGTGRNWNGRGGSAEAKDDKESKEDTALMLLKSGMEVLELRREEIDDAADDREDDGERRNTLLICWAKVFGTVLD